METILLNQPRRQAHGAVLSTDHFRSDKDSWVVRIVEANGVLKAHITDLANRDREVCYSFPGVKDAEEVRSQAFDSFYRDYSEAKAAGKAFPGE